MLVTDDVFYALVALVGGTTVLLVLLDMVRNSFQTMKTLKDENTALKDQLHVLRLKGD